MTLRGVLGSASLALGTSAAWFATIAAPPGAHAAAPAESAAHSAAVEDVRAFFERLGRLGFEGVVLLARGDEVLLAQGVGLAHHANGTPWSCETVSTVGSITKQFTAAAVMKLEEQGKLSVTDALAKWFDNAPADKSAITIHQLLAHTSGFPAALGDDFEPVGRDEFVAMAFAAPLLSPPGERYEYSNVGYSILGAIVEKSSGEPYETFLRRELLAPAGCAETGYLVGWDDARVAMGYREGEQWGTVLGKEWRPDGPGWHLRCNGGIHSTANDMLRWVNALRSGKVLSKPTLERMWSNHADEGGGESFYGYGWALPVTPWGRFVTHNGGNQIFFADLGFQPQTDGWVIMLMTNVSWDFPGAGQLMGMIARRLIAGEPLPDLPDARPLDAAQLASLSGSYALPDRGGVVTLTPGPAGSLVAEVAGPRAYGLMNGAAPSDSAACDDFTRRTTRFVTGILKRDYQPLFEAYAGRHSLEALTATYNDRLAVQEEELGAVTGFEIIGSAPLHGGIATLVRVDRARGSTWHRYQWDAQGVLDGQFPSRTAPRLALRHLGDGEFLVWTLREGAGVRVRIDSAGRGLTIAPGSGFEAAAQRQ